MFIQRIRKVQLRFVVCLMAMMSCETSFASQSDDFTLTVAPGKPPVKPAIASINEDVEFNFVPKLTDKDGKRIEETPSDVKSVSYTLTSDAEKITSCTPSMTISADKMSASTTKNKLQDVSATVNYAVEGDHTLTLDVTVTFKDDSTLSDSCTITVKVYKATLTVYADPPQNPGKLFRNAVCVTGNDIGHSFWKVDIEKVPEWGTDKRMTSFIDEQGNVPHVAGHPWGFYPSGAMKLSEPFATYDGEIGWDGSQNGHLQGAVAVDFNLKLDKAVAVIDETINLQSGHKYHLKNGVGVGQGKNCTGQTVHISNDIAGCSDPNGAGKVWWQPAPMTLPVPTSLLVPYANPYHHAQQINEVLRKRNNQQYIP